MVHQPSGYFVPSTPTAQPPQMPSSTDRRRQFEQCVDEHSPALYRVAWRMTGCESTASDLVQETFLQAWRGLESLRDAGRMRSWLFGILHNQYLKSVRSVRRMKPMDGVDLHHLATPMSETDADGELLQQALNRLDDDHRLPLLLHLMEELPVAKVARLLELPEGTVASRISRARKKLQAQLGPRLNVESGR